MLSLQGARCQACRGLSEAPGPLSEAPGPLSEAFGPLEFARRALFGALHSGPPVISCMPRERPETREFAAGSQKSLGRGKTVAKAPVKKTTAAKVPDKLTGASIVGYLAEKNGIARKDAKQVTEDLFDLIAQGVMRGERVAVGKIGKMFIRMRPARPARPGRNPATGLEIMIPAKPATKVPRFTFSKTFKEAALKAKTKK